MTKIIYNLTDNMRFLMCFSLKYATIYLCKNRRNTLLGIFWLLHIQEPYFFDYLKNTVI